MTSTTNMKYTYNPVIPKVCTNHEY